MQKLMKNPDTAIAISLHGDYVLCGGWVIRPQKY